MPLNRLLLPLRHGLRQTRQTLLDRVFGYDYFISYSHTDGLNYPKQLATRLEESGFKVFLDAQVYGPGDDLRTATRRRVRMSTYMIVVARPAAMGQSHWVAEEVRACLKAERTPVVIDVNDAFEKADPENPLARLLEHRLFINEDQPTDGGTYDGEPSAEVVRKLRRSFDATRQNALRLRVMTGIAITLGVLSVASLFLYARANTEQAATLAAMRDTSAFRQFSAAGALDLEREIEFDRYRKLKSLYDSAKVGAPDGGADPGYVTRLRVMEDELGQYRGAIISLRDRARKLREEAGEELRTADEQWKEFHARLVGVGQRARSRPSPPAIFSVEVLDAPKGESLILHYGEIDRPRFILIDGGIERVYRQHIAPRLAELREQWSDGAPLRLEMVIVSQSDVQRLEGINDLTDAMLAQREGGGEAEYSVGTVWFNHFLPITPEFAATLTAPRIGTRGKWRLAPNLLRLNVPSNRPFRQFVGRPSGGAVRVQVEGGLTITVLNPTPQLFAEYQESIADIWRKREVPAPAFPATDETFAGDGLTRVEGGGGAPFTVPPGRKIDRSPVNRASLVLMFEYGDESAPGGRKRFLYTGDANDVEVMEGLRAAGYLDADGKVRVDVLHIPHFGSDYNVSEEFFRRVVAKDYIITGDGTHNNPEPATLNMIVRARASDSYTLDFSYRIGLRDKAREADATAGPESLGNKLDEFFTSELGAGGSYRRIFRPPDDNSLLVNLLQPVRY
ncbi:MAG TPA: TIR domain-containing protein [Pyrinomonadaceae bacterium]